MSIYAHKTIPARDLVPGDLLAIGPAGRRTATEVTRVQHYGSIGYGTKPIADVYLTTGARATFEIDERVTVRITA